jgi:hypothetical protein
VRQVLTVGRAQMVPFGTKISVAVDRPRDPVHVFHAGNIIKDSFQVNYLSVADRANEYEFTFYDKTDRNKAKTVRYVDPKAVTFNETPRTATVDLQGVDNHAQAVADMWRAIYSNRLIMRTIQFENWLDSINMTIGEVALIQHDMMEWGASGRLAAGSTNLILNLDKAVTLDGPSNAIVHYDALQRATATVNMVAGKALILNKPGGADLDALQLASKRAVIGSHDYEIVSISNGASYITVQLTDVPVATPGDAVQLWDTDVIVETPVSAVTQNADGTSSVTLTTPLPQAPEALAGYAFGLVNSVRKPYVLNGIQGNGMEKRTLVFVEYNEGVYGPPEIEIPVPVQQISDRNVAQVRGLSLSFDQIVPANSTSLPVTVKWSSGHIVNYAGADIFVSINGSAPQSAGSAMNTSSYTLQVPVGADVRFIVIAFNKRGDRAPTVSAPMVHAIATPGFATLAPPTAFSVAGGVGKGTAFWTNPDDMTGVRNFEIQFKLASATDWSSAGFYGASPVELPGLGAGDYNARIRSASPTSASDWVDYDFSVVIGAGASASLAADHLTFDFIDGVPFKNTQVITLTVALQDSEESIDWSVTPAVPLGTTANPLQRTVSIADFGVNSQLVVTATGHVTGAKGSVTLLRNDQTTPDDSIIPDSNWAATVIANPTPVVNPGDTTARDLADTPWRTSGGFRLYRSYEVDAL